MPVKIKLKKEKEHKNHTPILMVHRYNFILF